MENSNAFSSKHSKALHSRKAASYYLNFFYREIVHNDCIFIYLYLYISILIVDFLADELSIDK